MHRFVSGRPLVRIRLGALAFSITQTETTSKARDRDELGATPGQLRFAPWGTEPGLATGLATIEHLCSGKTCACQTNARSPCARSIRPAAAYARSPTPRLLLGKHFLELEASSARVKRRLLASAPSPLERAGCVGRLSLRAIDVLYGAPSAIWKVGRGACPQRLLPQ